MLAFPAAAQAAKPQQPPPTANTCQAKNLQKKSKGSSVQTIINAATAGNTIEITGICKGALTVDKTLTLDGAATKQVAVPTLDGNQQGSVINQTGGALTVRDLKITNGSGTPTTGDPDFIAGAGIYNGGGTTLDAGRHHAT